MKGNIRIVLGETSSIPELPEWIQEKSEKYRTIYSILKELLESEQFNQIFHDFYQIAGLPIAIIDLNANVLASSQWQRICTDFHRVHEDTCARCLESDISLANQLEAGCQFTQYSCKNGLTDCASPIILEGEHVANLFIGQFLLETPNRDFFLQQAEEYQFPKEEYLKALEEVPVVGEARVKQIMSFLVHFARLVTSMSLNRLRERQTSLAARFGRLIERSLDEIHIFDATTLKFVLVNQGASTNLGYTMEELSQMTPLDIETIDSLVEFNQLLQPLRDGRQPSLIFETQHRRKDASLYDVEVHLQLMSNETPAVFVAIIQDITQRKIKERFREEVESIMRHDLKTPLNTIINIPEFLLGDSNLRPEQIEMLELLYKSGIQMLDQVNRSLDIFRIEQGTYHLQPQKILLLPLLSHIFKELEPIARRFGVKLILRNPENVSLFGEHLLLSTMFSNLIKNAVEASSADCQVTVSAQQRQDWVQISIHNLGVVPPTIKNRFFEKLVSSGKVGGTGLGTYSARLIVKIHQGRIRMHTSKTRGTIVTVLLPRFQPHS